MSAEILLGTVAILKSGVSIVPRRISAPKKICPSILSDQISLANSYVYV